MNFPTFAKIRTERAAREMRGVILPFERTVEQETAAENSLASTWGELWIHLFDLWEGACLDFMHGVVTWDRVEIVNRQAEADHTGRLLADLFEEA